MYFRLVAIAALILLAAGCGRSRDELLREGRQLQGEGNLRGAIVLYKNALEKNPGDVEARFLLADCYLAAARFDLSEKEFRKTALQDPSRAEVHLRLAELYIRTRRPDPARAELDAYSRMRGDDPRGSDLLGQALLLKRDVVGAERAFRRALQLDPALHSASLYLADTLMRTRRDAEARQLLSELLRRDPRNIPACHLLARLDTAAGEIDGALGWYRKIRQIDPANAEAAYLTGLLLLEKGEIAGAEKVAADMLRGAPAGPEGFQLRGLVRFVKEDYRDAVVHLTKALEGRPDLTALYFLGLSHMKLGGTEQALNQFQRFLDYRPEAVQPRVMVAAILLRQKRVDDAVRELDRVLKVDGRNAPARTLLGNAYLSRGDYELAMAEFDKALAIDPSLPEAHYRKGLFSFSRGDFEAGEKELARAVAAAPEIPESRLLLALRYLHRRNLPEAVRLLEGGLQGKGEDALIYNYLAVAHFGRNLPEKGVEALRKAKEINPDYLPSYYNLASWYLRQGDSGRALREYQGALGRRPGDPAVVLAAAETARQIATPQALDMALHLTESAGELRRGDLRVAAAHAALLEKRERWQDALAAYREIETRSGGNPGVLFAIGTLHDRLGDKEKALGYYQKILSREAEFTPALNNLACLYAERPAERSRALELARRAHQLDPENPLVLDTLGYVLVRLGKGEEAVPLLKKAALRLPESPTVHYHLALAYFERRREAEAADALRRALALGAFPEAGDARLLLAGFSGNGKGKRQ